MYVCVNEWGRTHNKYEVTKVTFVQISLLALNGMNPLATNNPSPMNLPTIDAPQHATFCCEDVFAQLENCQNQHQSKHMSSK